MGALSKKSWREISDWDDRDNRGEIKRIPVGNDENLGIPKYSYLDKESQYPRMKLADPKTLFQRLYNKDKRYEGGAGGILEVNQRQRRSFGRLNDLRTKFTHFSPKGWSVELTGLPVIFGDVLDVLEMIREDPWPFRHLQDSERQKLTDLITELRAEISQISI